MLFIFMEFFSSSLLAANFHQVKAPLSNKDTLSHENIHKVKSDVHEIRMFVALFIVLYVITL